MIPSPFNELGKQAGVGSLVRSGVKSLWNNGVWQTAAKAAERGVGRADLIGKLSRGVQPVANTMNGRVGKALGLYGMAGMASPLLGVDLPGSTLATNLSMPGVGLLHNAGSLLTVGRMGNKQNQQALRADVQRGSDMAVQDYLSGIQMAPSLANNADAYREFSNQIGRGMKGADTYTAGGYKPMGAWHSLQKAFEDPQDLITNRTRAQVQGMLPQLMKGAGIGGAIAGGIGHTMTGLGLLGGGIGLAHAALSKKPYDAEAAQNEGYSAAQAAIQNRLRNMTGFERFMTNLDPTLVSSAIKQKMPGATAAWESQNGPVQPGMIASTVNAFRTGGTPSFYSTDANGSKHYV